MNKENLNQLFRQADTELNIARNELYKPSRDVVTYSVCISARSALYRFMQCLYQLYAEENNKPVEESLSLFELLEFSRQYNVKLNTLDFSRMNCINRDVRQEKEEHVYFCDDTCMVQECTDAAVAVRELVIAKAGDTLQAG